MIEKIKKITSKKQFHIIVIILIILFLLFFLALTILRYNVEGEKNMPFLLTKISVISQSIGSDKQVEGMKWAFDVNQTNDIYIYIEKNPNYEEEELIKSITIDSLALEKSPMQGETKFYKPEVQDVNMMFKNTEENETNNIEYLGDIESDIKNLKISNQGGLVAFRYSINNIAEYTSNEDEQVEHKQLLNKAGVQIENIKSKIKFNLTINLESGKSFQSEIMLDVPLDGVIEEGVVSSEFTDMSGYIFKRIKNKI